MGRRRLMKSLVGAGFGASAYHLTSEDVKAAASDQVPIVYAYARDPENPSSLKARTKNVPADWYNDLQHAFSVHNSKTFTNLPGVRASWVSPGERGGENASIEVDITDEVARGNAPESVEGVPVKVNKVGEFQTGNCNTKKTDSTVPGSVECDDGDGYATLAPRLYDPANSDEYFATSNHVFGGANGGESLYQADGENGNNKIGTVENGYCYMDLAIATPVNRSPAPAIKLEIADEVQVSGSYSKAGLSDIKSQGKLMYKVGVTTCSTQGKIKAVDGQTCAYGCRCKDGQVKWGTQSHFDDGDSGSVTYHPDPDISDSVIVGNMNNAVTWWTGENYVWGTGAYHIKDSIGMFFA